MRAQPLGDGEASLRGEKWFCSAPMSDAFLVLAQAPAGLTCYLVPRVLPDGTRNAFHIHRLKDKLGNRSNASAEIELENAWARRVGEEGRGIATIMEMVVHTRLDCVLGSLGLMRRAVAEATHYAAHRRAFGRRLIEQPLMTNVLADLCIDSEAATMLALRLARAYDEDAVAFRRLATAAAKYWVCKATPPLVAEALECIGGNGFVEESVLPRLFRESPLNSIWEGAGNVQALDVLRAVERQPESLEAVLAEIDAVTGADARLDAAVAALRVELSEAADGANARRVVERLALCLSAALLLRAESPVADAFCATRLAGEGGRAYGTLPRGVDAAGVVERHLPLLPR
jgi:putative acyl-CoA dehydrogenase